jgi:putative addiction module antidote
MVELKVRKFGNSLGVVLPKEVIRKLQTAEGEKLLLIEAPNGSYSIAQSEELFAAKMRTVEDLMHRYRNTLRILSK